MPSVGVFVVFAAPLLLSATFVQATSAEHRQAELADPDNAGCVTCIQQSKAAASTTPDFDDNVAESNGRLLLRKKMRQQTKMGSKKKGVEILRFFTAADESCVMCQHLVQQVSHFFWFGCGLLFLATLNA